MTHEEAIAELDKCKGNVEALLMAKEALEKQTPKKPIVQKTAFFCPVCSTNVGFRLEEESGLLAHYGKYCEICGQAIDWSEEK